LVRRQGSWRRHRNWRGLQILTEGRDQVTFPPSPVEPRAHAPDSIGALAPDSIGALAPDSIGALAGTILANYRSFLMETRA